MSITSENQDFEVIKPFIYENYQQYRILQPKVVFIHGLPQKYANFQILTNYLTNYGKVIYLSIQFISKNFFSSFVHFETQISSSLTIAALDNFYLQKRTLKVSYASTKFCPHFLRGFTCYMQNCNYAHYYIAQLAHLKDFAKQINHKSIALNKIWQNYQEAILYLFKTQQSSSVFPTGISKLNEILFIKSQEFYEWERKIRQTVEIIQRQLKKKSQKNQPINKYDRLKKSRTKFQQLKQQLKKDDWLNLDHSIHDFVGQTNFVAQSNSFMGQTNQTIFTPQMTQFLERKNKTKTKIQQFLEESQLTLMDLIFKSQHQQSKF